MKLASKILAAVALLFSLFVAWQGMNIWRSFTKVQQQMDGSDSSVMMDCLGAVVVLVPVIVVIVVLWKSFRGAGVNVKAGSLESNVPKQ